MTYRGITWDHPRGRQALEAAARAARERGEVDIEWEAHSLEHFESHPIDDLAQRYDLIVLDHPHLGEALAHESLQPLDDHFDRELLDAWAASAVGPSFTSYAMEGRQWALPIDAATQVAVHRAGVQPPATWAEVVQLSLREPVALSLAGPHAFLTFASMCAAAGDPVPEHGLPADDTVAEVIETMREITARAPAGTADQNPIRMLQRLSTGDDLVYVPLVYGYVNYASASTRFSDAPAWRAGGRRGSTIGGTGLAISRRSKVTPALAHHLAWLMSEPVQRGFIPQQAGQPGARAAWAEPVVDAAASGFYSGTLATIEQSWVRPRYDGYIAFQSRASAVIRDLVTGGSTIPGPAALREAAGT